MVVNKIDVPGVLELRDELLQEAEVVLGEKTQAVLFVSAAGYQGLDELKEVIFRILGATPISGSPAEQRGGELPVLRPLEGGESRPAIVVEADGFRITHPRAVRLAAASDLKLWKARLQMRDQLQKMGVTRRLEEMGVKSGDKVRVASWEFVWE